MIFEGLAWFFNAKLPSGFNEPLGLRLVCELGFAFRFRFLLFGHNAALPS
jgi:hypothetical protein